jgi:putative Mg2+ transporter-C (MgtC) family protein
MLTQQLLRLLAAAIMGSIVGLDREYRAKDAGFRTHSLVALGSALFMILSQFGFEEVRQAEGMSLDPSRIASQVVSGIGFIGAGTIIFQRHVLRGLTTAAGIWCTAAVGMACGAGLYTIAAITTLLTIISLEAFNVLLRRFGGRNVSLSCSAPSKEHVLNVVQTIERNGISINRYNMEKKTLDEGHFYAVELELRVPREGYITRLLKLMEDFDGVSIDNME